MPNRSKQVHWRDCFETGQGCPVWPGPAWALPLPLSACSLGTHHLAGARGPRWALSWSLGQASWSGGTYLGNRMGFLSTVPSHPRWGTGWAGWRRQRSSASWRTKWTWEEVSEVFWGSREHTSMSSTSHPIDATVFCTYQRFLFTGTKPSFSETFVKTTEISPYNGGERC